MLRGSITSTNGIVGSSGTAAHIDSMSDVTDRCAVPAADCAFHFASSRLRVRPNSLKIARTRCSVAMWRVRLRRADLGLESPSYGRPDPQASRVRKCPGVRHARRGPQCGAVASADSRPRLA